MALVDFHVFSAFGIFVEVYFIRLFCFCVTASLLLCMAFSSCSELGLLLVVVRRLLLSVVASLTAKQGLMGFRSVALGSRAGTQQLWCRGFSCPKGMEFPLD